MKKILLATLLWAGWMVMAAAGDIRADVTRVTATGSKGVYTFHVTLSSDETGCAQYADWWEVLDEKGALLYRRILFHSHPDDQPFARSGGTVPLRPTQKIYIRAHMNKLGYVGDLFEGSIEKGFGKTATVPDFPKSLETQAPLPNGCAF